jgi:hypothetical protein
MVNVYCNYITNSQYNYCIPNEGLFEECDKICIINQHDAIYLLCMGVKLGRPTLDVYMIICIYIYISSFTSLGQRNCTLWAPQTQKSVTIRSQPGRAVAYPGILFGWGSTNSFEDRGQKERGSGGGSPPVRGLAQFANEWDPYSY